LRKQNNEACTRRRCTGTIYNALIGSRGELATTSCVSKRQLRNFANTRRVDQGRREEETGTTNERIMMAVTMKVGMRETKTRRMRGSIVAMMTRGVSDDAEGRRL
jgi:hypothetical protein